MAENPRNDARQLRQLNFDLANYFSNTIIPQLFVDADFILRIFTPPAMEQFSLTYAHVGMNIGNVKDNLRYPNVVEDIREVIDDPNKILEKEVQTTDGRWFQMNVVPYMEYEENVINGVIITFVDITKRLLALRDLEKLNSKYETLMYAFAHDIRQPISAITLVADGLLMAHKKNDSSQLRKWANTLKESSRSLENLVEDFASGKEGNPGDSSEKVARDIKSICENVLISLQLEIKERSIEVTTDLKVGEIIFPKSSLRSVVYNLVHNAVKYSDPKKASEIKVSTELIEDYIILCVQDNGIGIAFKDQRRVFKKSSRISRDIKGTGMGLYVVKKMIEDHEGRIKLESKQGEGTTLKVFFKNN